MLCPAVSKEAQPPPEADYDVAIPAGSLPNLPHLGSFGLPRGHAYACMAETMLLAIDGNFESKSMGGQLRSDALDRLRDLATVHGFRAAS